MNRIGREGNERAISPIVCPCRYLPNDPHPWVLLLTSLAPQGPSLPPLSSSIDPSILSSFKHEPTLPTSSPLHPSSQFAAVSVFCAPISIGTFIHLDILIQSLPGGYNNKVFTSKKKKKKFKFLFLMDHKKQTPLPPKISSTKSSIESRQHPKIKILITNLFPFIIIPSHPSSIYPSLKYLASSNHLHIYHHHLHRKISRVFCFQKSFKIFRNIRQSSSKI